MKEKPFKPSVVGLMMGMSAIILLACSCLRHVLFQSSAWYLGIFDQAVYLISQGQPPISSFLGFHILGDHAALVLYPLSLLYKIFPAVYCLLAVQAVALSLGALPVWYLARHAGLKAAQATTMAAVYLLYPLVFNINLFDFHPEVIALPALLGAILAAQLGQVGWFCVAILLVLSCKAVLALTVAAMGIWLLVCESPLAKQARTTVECGEETRESERSDPSLTPMSFALAPVVLSSSTQHCLKEVSPNRPLEKRRLCGVIAISVGVAWFLIATQAIIPFFGQEATTVSRHILRYNYLGDSLAEIISNLLLNPQLVLERVFSLSTLEYLVLLILPVIWGLSPHHLTPLVAAIPTLMLNILSESPTQRNLVHQYSLPILPFLLLAVISTLAAGEAWLRSRQAIMLWSLWVFLILGKYGYFWSSYLNSLDTWQATREAVAQIQTKGGVLTAPQIAPHLTHRPVVQLTTMGSESADLTQIEYVLLNLRHLGGSPPEVVTILLERLTHTAEFQLTYQRDDVYLFRKQS